MNITGNTVFIPGATSGIGLELALALQARGNTVIVGGRRTELLDQIAAEHPGIATVRIDTADAASISTVSAQVIAEHPDVNVLIAMAGIMQQEDWRTPDFLASAEATVTTNLLGPIRLVAAFTEHLQAQDDATIVTVSSGLAFIPFKTTPTYSATKAGIHMLSEAIRLQFDGTSVRVLEIEPPSVQTDLTPGHAEDPHAQPLDEYIAETMSLIETQPEATEIQVERVGFLRHAEVRGDYPQVVATVNGLG